MSVAVAAVLVWTAVLVFEVLIQMLAYARAISSMGQRVMARLDVVTTILCDRRAAQLVHAVPPQSSGSGAAMDASSGGAEVARAPGAPLLRVPPPGRTPTAPRWSRTCSWTRIVKRGRSTTT